MRKVLIVDDDVVFLDFLREVVSSLGYECVAIHNGEEALQTLIHDADISIIVSDINMPGIDGITLLKEIEDRFMEDRCICCIIMTSYESFDKAIEAVRHSAIDFLSKSDISSDIGPALRRASSKLSRLEARLPRSVSEVFSFVRNTLNEDARSLIRDMIESDKY